MKKNTYIKTFIISILLTLICMLPGYTENEKSSIAILKSTNSAQEYSTQHLGPYNTIFDDVLNTLDHSNLKYEIISEYDIKSGLNSDDYKVIIVPMALSLPENTISNISSYLNKGGKIIVSDPGGKFTKTAFELANLVNTDLRQSTHLEHETSVSWNNSRIKPKEDTFPPSSRLAIIHPDSSSETIAYWNDSQLENGPAVTKSDNGCYISWPIGTEGNIAFNTYTIKNTINSLIPGLTSLETVKITPNKYEKYITEIDQLNNSAEGALSTVIQADLSVPLTKVQEQMYMSGIHKALFQMNYADRRYASAKQEYDKAKKSIIQAYARSIPSRLVEGRALWLDRGTVVSVKTPQEMKKLFDKIEEAGINVVYIETINAGFPIYPSRYIEQNPLTKGYDPLKYAIKEAHERDIELHAWAWIFAVGNTRHNVLIDKPKNYPGPIISNNFYDGAMLGQNGNLLPNNQTEYWLNPANEDVRKLQMNILKEIVTNYDVDGIQLDYIRYPFQSSRNLMGFDFAGKELFEKETGYSLDNLNSETLNAWKDWKTKKISTFVEQVSRTLRHIKPDIQISAAVYAGDRRKRLDTIQQDWESWIDNGWVDTLSPMSYATDTEKLTELAGYVKDASNNKALVYPGLAIRQLDTANFLEQLDTVRSLGMVGNTIFAMAHLNNDKLDILETGPYRNKSLVIPNRNPMKASSLLLEDFLVRVHRFINNDKIFSLSDDTENKVKQSAQNLYALIQESSSKPSIENINAAYEKSVELSNLVKDWLSFENNIRPGRVRLLTDYLNQISSILQYAKHKEATKYKALGTTRN
ncbi:MAG: glycoside hydrolase family 10 protein [Vampirovibrionia bacterium]